MTAIPLVLLPGFMCDGRLFGPQTQALSDLANVQTPVPRAATLQAMAEAVLASAPPRFALGGLSMGGIIALEVMARAPERVTHLALMDTTPLADAPENHAIRTRQMADVRAGQLDAVMRDELKPAYLVDSPRKPALLDLCMAMARDLGADVFASQATALRDRPSHLDTLATIAVPTLVLCGAEDRLCPPSRHEMMAERITGARLTLIENAGHLPTLEQPDATTAALRDWLVQPPGV